MYDQRERIISVDIEDEMKNSYLDYAMSVIIGRALPDVRDGLKPVHRRIIYTMNGLGVQYGKPYKKCARIVGDCMGKYHPHGDAAIYDTLVRMAQDFSQRYPLVDGQGNFGSIDGDPPAAYRYTEARMSKIAGELLTDIDKETVDFVPNFDGEEMEPTVLPSIIPNLLINGSSGIAVGMATNIPPHNISETVDAVIAYIDNPDITVPELMKHLPGPDFPTGSFICGISGIKQAYETGRGKIVLRAKAYIEQQKSGKEAIIVTEIPYMVLKQRLIEQIAELVRDKKIEGITDLRDESDREGMRIYIELRRGENANVVLNQLYKHTKMQTSFGIIMLALVESRPRYLSLPKVIHYYVEHRKDVVVRRSRYELEKAEHRAHIVEGLRIAIDNIDAIIKVIRKSKDVEEARVSLMEKFKLSFDQANAILDMRLQRLTALETEKLIEEYKELIKKIEYLRSVLRNPKMVLKIIKDELKEVKKNYSDTRKTEIVAEAEELDIEDLIAEENMVITVSHQGYIKRIPTSTYRKQRRGGKGITGMSTKEEDWVEHLFIGTTHNYILFFTNKGKVYRLKVYDIPQGNRYSKGKAIINLLPVESGELITAMIPIANYDDKHFIFMATRMGTVKKVNLMQFENMQKKGKIAILLDERDLLECVALTNGQNEIFMASKSGMATRFHESEVRSVGRATRGVIGMDLEKGDEIVGMEVFREGASILTVCENGYGKKTPVEEYRLIHRGGKGVINIRTTERNGQVISIKEVMEDDELILMTQHGMVIRLPISTLRDLSRATQGVRLIKLEEGDKLTGVARVCEEEEEEQEETTQETAIKDEEEVKTKSEETKGEE